VNVLADASEVALPAPVATPISYNPGTFGFSVSSSDVNDDGVYNLKVIASLNDPDTTVTEVPFVVTINDGCENTVLTLGTPVGAQTYYITDPTTPVNYQIQLT